MKKHLFTYLGIVIGFMAMDTIWLGYLAIDTYRASMGDLLREDFLMTPAVLFYITYTLAILILVVAPNAEKGGKKVALMGAIYGFAAYATYDLTNYAVMANFPLDITIIDLIWGVIITTTASMSGYMGYKIANR